MKKSYLQYAVLVVAALLVGFSASPEAAVAATSLGDISPNTFAITAAGLAAMGFSGMIMDEYGEFCDATSVAAAASTALVGDVIDLGAGRDIGNSGPLYLVINVDTEIITGGVAGTIQFKLASDAQAAIAVDGSATEHFVSAEFVTDDAGSNDAELNAGGVPVIIALPQEGKAYERYLGILVVIGTTTVTAGAINAFLTPDPTNWKSLPDASN